MRHLILAFLVVATSSAFGQDPIEYIKDERLISINGNEVEVNSISIARESEILIKNEAGIELMKGFRLPEPVDPTYYDISAASRLPDFHIEIEKIETLEVIITRKGKTIRVDTEKPKKDRKKVLNKYSNLYGYGTIYRVEMPNLMVDDVVKIKYNILIPYPDNEHNFLSFRVFLDGKYKCRESELRIEYPDGETTLFAYRNGAIPDKNLKMDRMIDKWERTDLPGALDEVGAYPYEELPHIEVVCASTTGNFQSEDGGNSWQYFKGYTNTLYSDYLNAIARGPINRQFQAFRIGSTYKQFLLARDFVKAHKQTMEGDTSLISVVKSINNRIAEDFDYQGDAEYFEGDQLFEPKFGEDLMKDRIREVNKIETYSSWLNRADCDFILGFPMDKRVGKISEMYFQSKFQSDYLLMPILETGNSLFIYPKNQKVGYYVDELPFYFEGTTFEYVYLGGTEMLTNDKGEMKLKLNFNETPESTENDNVRTTNARVSIDGENKQTFQFQITLNGQFSTLMRPGYIANESSRYVKDAYNQKWWHGMNISQLQSSANVTTSNFPFSTKVMGSFVYQPKEGMIDCGQWIDHIVDQVPNERTLTYHPDFRQSDKFTIQYVFDVAPTSITLPEAIVVENEYATYSFDVKQISENTVLMNSQLVIREGSLSAGSIGNQIELQNAIKQAQQSVISFQ